MKINFRWGIKTFSGFGDDMVYQSCLNKKICIGRDYTYPEITDNNHSLGAIGKNMTFIYKHVSAPYMQDLKIYRYRYKQQYGNQRNPFKRNPIPGSLSLLVKMMYNWGKSDPEHVDLATITIADIVALDANVRTIRRAVEAGFLPTIFKYEDLTAGIQ